MSFLKYNFCYLVIPDSIYHFSYKNFEDISITNNEILLKRNKTNRNINFDNFIIELEKKYKNKLKNTNNNISLILNSKENNLFIENEIKLKNLNSKKNNLCYNKQKSFNFNKNISKIKTDNIFTNIKHKSNRAILSNSPIYIKKNIQNPLINIENINAQLNRKLSIIDIKTLFLLKNNSNYLKGDKTFELNNINNSFKSTYYLDNNVLYSKTNTKDIDIANKYLIKNKDKSIKLYKSKIVNKNKNQINLSSQYINKRDNKKIKLDDIDIKYFNKNSKFIEYKSYLYKFNKYFNNKVCNINNDSNLLDKSRNKTIRLSNNFLVSKHNTSTIHINKSESIENNNLKPIKLFNNIVFQVSKNHSKNIYKTLNHSYFSKLHNKKIFYPNTEMIKRNFNKVTKEYNNSNIASINKYSNRDIINFKTEEFVNKFMSRNVVTEITNQLGFFSSNIEKKTRTISNNTLVNKECKSKYNIYINKDENLEKISKNKLKDNNNEIQYSIDKIQNNTVQLDKDDLIKENIKRPIKTSIENYIQLSKYHNKKIYLDNNIKLLLKSNGNNSNKYIEVIKNYTLNKSIKNKIKNSDLSYNLNNKNDGIINITLNKNFLLNNTTNSDKKIIIKSSILLTNKFRDNSAQKMKFDKEILLNNKRKINNNLKTEDIYKINHIPNKYISLGNTILTDNNSNKKIQIKNTKLISSKNRNIKMEKPQQKLKLYKSLWFIRGIGETDLKILPNVDFNYPASIDIFVEKPNFTYSFEYESGFDKYYNEEYIIELYDYNYNMISTLSIPQVQEIETKNDIISLKIEKVILNNLNENEKQFKFTIKCIYPKLSYIIIRQPIDNYLNSVLYTVTEKFLGENRHPIPFGSDLGIIEIPIHINIMIEFINILLLMWQHRFLAFSGQVGIHAIYGLVNLVYEWLTLDTSKENEYIEEYYRCFRWLRWEAEKVYNIAKVDPKLNGNKWINFVINEMIDYMEMHHIDVLPIIEKIRDTDDWRNSFTDPTFDIRVMLDKFKGERKRLISNKNRMTSAKTI